MNSRCANTKGRTEAKAYLTENKVVDDEKENRISVPQATLCPPIHTEREGRVGFQEVSGNACGVLGVGRAIL